MRPPSVIGPQCTGIVDLASTLVPSCGGWIFESARPGNPTPTPSTPLGCARDAVSRWRSGSARSSASTAGRTTIAPIRDHAPSRFATLDPMEGAWQDEEFLRHVFDETQVVRKPITGIITGYHVLPYIIVGPEHDQPHRSVEVRGRIKVSPRLILTPNRDGPTYGELFGDRELMDQRLVARVFSFRYASRVALESEDLKIRRQERDAPGHVERVLD